MENNKTYLQRIHWAAIIALGGYLLLRFIIAEQFVLSRNIYTIIEVSMILLPFAALGAVTNKWREAIIACAIGLAIHFIDERIARSIGRSDATNFLRFLLRPFPLLLFVALQTEWKKAGVVYLLCLISGSLSFGQFTGNPAMLVRAAGMIDFSSSVVLHYAYYIGAFVAHVIFTCEIINYANEKAMAGKIRLLNLGNIYNKYNSLLAFWSIKTALWYLVGSGIGMVSNYVEIFQNDGRSTGSFYSDFTEVNPTLLYKISSLISLLAWIAAAMLLAWYFRKFLLELFITYDIRSKTIYWLSFLPVIGFLFAAATVGPAKQQHLYIEKTSSINGFVNSSGSTVITIFMVLLGIRLLSTLSNNGDGIAIIFLLVTAALFFWMSVDKNGFYVYLYLNLLLLAAGVIATFFAKWDPETVAILMVFTLLGTVQLIFLFPVFHFEEFEYIPAEEPSSDNDGTQEEFHLFPAMK